MPELRKVLYVEDDPGIREIVTVSLTTLAGLEVLACASAAEALAGVEQFAPDLLLLDYMMPEVDGVAALKALRRIPATSTTPALLVTAVAPSALPPELADLGVIELIRKPFDPLDLPNVLQNAWESQG
ncbi:MAG: response regulator [Wenzhouxiangella sp.]|nr:response regulator [Wenzhouxiangella sp.]MCH8479026.1 response regulator [Wenzhouxiangella sp.]